LEYFVHSLCLNPNPDRNCTVGSIPRNIVGLCLAPAGRSSPPFLVPLPVSRARLSLPLPSSLPPSQPLSSAPALLSADAMTNTLQLVTGVTAIFAAIATILYVWLKRDSVRLVNEVILELALLVLLFLAVTTFTGEAKLFRRRIRISVGLMYGTALFSIICFGISIAMSAARDRNDPSVKNISYRLSQTCWVLFLVTSIAALIAFFTVSRETNAANFGAGKGIIDGLLLPSLIAVCVVFAHFICACANCCFRNGKKWYSWRDSSAYHELTLKILMTFGSGVLLLLPISMALNDGSHVRGNSKISTEDKTTFMIDLLAAGIHRMILAEHDREIGRAAAEKLKERDLEAQLSVAGSAPSLPSPAASGSVVHPAAVSAAPRGVPPPPPSSAAPSDGSAILPAEPLAQGWRAARVPDGPIYYVCTATGQTSWARPAAPHLSPKTTAVTAQPAPGWTATLATDGRTYCYHAQSGRTSWECPSPMV
jgi:hypothetical protein